VTTSVVWFHRDLRLHDHPALTAAQADGDRIAPLFVIDERFQAGRFRSAKRLWLMRGSVSALATALESRCLPREVVHAPPPGPASRPSSTPVGPARGRSPHTATHPGLADPDPGQAKAECPRFARISLDNNT
jgi:hypothetical protein